MVMMIKKPRDTQKGSAFFYILLGVVLFGTLAFTVSRGMRGQQTEAMSDRQAELAAADIIAYGQKIMRAVDKLRRKGCSENEITFEDNNSISKKTNGTAFDYTNPNSPGDFSCHVFHESGGGVIPQLLPESFVVDPSPRSGDMDASGKFYRY